MTIKLDKVYDDYMKKYAMVMEQKEEILTAFIAKYGTNPEDLVCVEWRKSPFETLWFIKTKEQLQCCKCKNFIGEE